MKKLLVLAAGILQMPVIKKAKEMGLEPARNENTVILQPKPVPRFVTRKEGDPS